MATLDASHLPLVVGLAGAGLLAGWLAFSGQPDPLGVSYAAGLDDFRDRVTAEVASYGTGRTEGDQAIPVIHPPPGDVAILARRWEFTPALELDPGQSYHLHLLSEDGVHTAVIQGHEVMLVPGRAQVVTITAPHSGQVAIQCGEYCGLGHNRMAASAEILR